MSLNLLSSASAKQLRNLLYLSEQLCGLAGVPLLSLVCASITALTRTVSGKEPEAVSPSLAPSGQSPDWACLM